MCETTILTVRYLGNTKAQAGYDQRVAFGHDGKEWMSVFPESVLVDWMSGVSSDPSKATTLYGVLGVSRDASGDEIRKAFRSAARKWHSDTNQLYQNSDPVFIRIKEAYDILSNENKRARYNAGIALEKTIRKEVNPPQQDWTQGFRPTKRAGYVLVEGTHNSRGQFVVKTILDWQPITDDKGRELISTWRTGEKTYTENWMVVAQPAR